MLQMATSATWAACVRKCWNWPCRSTGSSPAHKDHAELAGDERDNKVVGEVLAKIAERHSTRESYMDDARQDLAEARAFVERKHLLTLPRERISR